MKTEVSRSVIEDRGSRCVDKTEVAGVWLTAEVAGE